MTVKLIDVRCRECGKLFFRYIGDSCEARIEIVCPGRSCRRFQTFKLAELSASA